MLGAITNPDIGFAAADQPEIVRGRDRKFDLRMAALESGEARHQPLRSQRRRRRDAQARTGIAFQPGGGGAKLRQDVTHIGQVAFTEAGERDIAVDADEQRYAEKFLKRLDAMAHGRLREMQFFRGLQKAHQPRRGFEREEVVQRRQS